MTRSWVLFFIAAPFGLFAQQLQQQIELDSIVAQNQRVYLDEYHQALEYSKKFNLPMTYSDQFRTVSLVGVEDDLPIFLATDNVEAAITTGVVKLRLGNPLGMNLEGNSMRVGVWDGGKVNHIEFGDRILSTEGANSDNHATHVTGTIAASGINPDVKGMAPKAKIVSFDFNNAFSEMASLAKPDQSTIILSNHSYGFVTGWDCTVSPCQWRGNPSINSQEDFRFGFYSNSTREWDRIANNAPYYTMVKSAGNDRSDRGASSAIYPPDCNGGSGFDCIEEQATAKNIITVGAVNPVLNYVDESSVIMSTFSGWGPTDDGRIKPDVVADGVSLLSTTLNNGYGRLSGTSMSTPNVTGSLTLLQELNRKLTGGNFMRSSTLKALAIHTARECGLNPGPDYSFGWGLLDVEAAARLLINKDNQNVHIEEIVLRNGETFNLALSPKANTKITVTLAWNDPAGMPVPNALDPSNLMLVNDIDARILDGQTLVQSPWVLNPEVSALGQPAFKGDNFRDNIEKIEFESPEEKVYNLRISHKGILRNGSQIVSLVVSYSSAITGVQTLYWVGNSGDWSDTNHWSYSSGGAPAGVSPGSNNRVVIDENSFSSPGAINFSQNVSCKSFAALSSIEKVDLQLNDNVINVFGDLLVADSTFFSSTQGSINLFGGVSAPNRVNLFKANFPNTGLFFDGNAFVVNATGTIGKVILSKGSLDLKETDVSLSELNAVGLQPKTLILSNAKIRNLAKSRFLISENLSLQSDSVQISSSTGQSIFDWNGIELSGTLSINSNDFTLTGNNSILKSRVNGSVKFDGNNSINDLTVSGGSVINVLPGTVQTFTSKVLMQSNSSSRIKVQSTSAAAFFFAGKYRLCFDFLDIINVSIAGNASVNAGKNSSIVDSQSWFQDECDNVILADFDIQYGCVGSKTQLTSSILGLVTNYSWEILPGGGSIENRNASATTAVFPSASDYSIRLTVSNQRYSRTVERPIKVLPNDLNENQILVNGLNLFSKESATSYQWFRDNQPIQNAISRSFLFNGNAGTYSVVSYSQKCNRSSAPLIITSVGNNSDEDINVFPNPASSFLFFKNVAGPVRATFIDMVGRIVEEFEQDFAGSGIDISNIPPGIFVVLVETEKGSQQFKIMVNR